MQTSAESLVIHGEDHEIDYDYFLAFGTKLLSGIMTVNHPKFLLSRPVGDPASRDIIINIQSIGIHHQPGLSYQIDGMAWFSGIEVESQLFTGFISFESKKWILAIIEESYKNWQIAKIQAEFPLHRQRFDINAHPSLE